MPGIEQAFCQLYVGSRCTTEIPCAPKLTYNFGSRLRRKVTGSAGCEQTDSI